MPRAEPSHTPPSNPRKRRLTSQNEFPWDPPAPHSDNPEPQPKASKKPRLARGRGTGEGGAYMRLDMQERVGPMTDPVQSTTRPVKKAVAKVASRRVPTSENDPPVPPARASRSAAPTSAPTSSLRSPFQYRSRTTSTAAAKASHPTSLLGSPVESGTGLRGRARAASLRTQQYTAITAATRREKNVPRPAEPAISLMATLISTPLATSTPKGGNTPGAHMDIDTLTLQDADAESAESDAPAATRDKTKSHTISVAEGRATIFDDDEPNDEDNDDLNDMFSVLGLDEDEKWSSPQATRRDEKKDKKFRTRFTSNAKQGMRAEGKKNVGAAENKLKAAALGTVTPAHAIKPKLKKENIEAKKQTVRPRPIIHPLQPKQKAATTIPIVVVKQNGRKIPSPVSKAFVQRKRTSVWMKINEQAVEVNDDSSDDEIAAW